MVPSAEGLGWLHKPDRRGQDGAQRDSAWGPVAGMAGFSVGVWLVTFPRNVFRMYLSRPSSETSSDVNVRPPLSLGSRAGTPQDTANRDPAGLSPEGTHV